MRLLNILWAVSLWISYALAELPASLELFYWPVGAPQPSILAHVAYDPVSLKSNLLGYHPPTNADKDSLVRVGFYTTSPTNARQWIGCLVTLDSLTGIEHQPTFRLHIGPATDIYHVSLAASSVTATESITAGPQVELVLNLAGTQPQLNQPVVVGPDGQHTEEMVEKTLLQK